MKKSLKYVSATYLAERTSLTTRWFTKQACEGKIPGAVQPNGPGGTWRFDEDQFWRWWGEKERKPWYPRIDRREPDIGGGASSETAATSGNRLRQLLGMPPREEEPGVARRKPRKPL